MQSIRSDGIIGRCLGLKDAISRMNVLAASGGFLWHSKRFRRKTDQNMIRMTSQSMRIFILLLISLVLSSSWSRAVAAEQPEQWVVYEGKSGPGKGKHIVLISGDEEYRSEETLTQLGKILAAHHGFKCTVLFSIDRDTGIVNPDNLSNIPGLAALKNADLMVIFVRFRNLPDDQMQRIDDYLKSGKPVLGIRTSTHAFKVPVGRKEWLHYDYRYNAPSNWVHPGNWVHYDAHYSGEKKEWERGFGGLILGDTWYYHYGYHNNQSTRGIIAAEARGLPITRGLKNGDIWGPTDVYAVRLPLPGDAMPIIMGQTINRKNPRDDKDIFFGMRPTDDEVASTGNNPTADRGQDRYNPNDPMMPVAWTKSYRVPGGKKGRVFATTTGAATDLLSDGTRRMLVNGVYWCVGLEKKIPAEGTKVDIVGSYNPTPFRFQSNDYWKKKGMKPSDFKWDN